MIFAQGIGIARSNASVMANGGYAAPILPKDTGEHILSLVSLAGCDTGISRLAVGDNTTVAPNPVVGMPPK